MKKIIFLFFAAAFTFIGSGVTSAQGKYGPDSTECIKYLSYYTEYYKQKNYDAALPNWRKAYKYCPPTSRYTMLQDGTTLLRKEIQKNMKNAAYMEKLVDSLMVIYDQRVEFWPKYAESSLNNKALDMYNFMKNEPAVLYEGLDSVIETVKSNTLPNIYLYYLKTAIDLYNDGLIDPEKVIASYEKAVKYLSEKTPKNDTEKKMIDKTGEDLQNLFIQSQVASCDNLIALFGPRFEADPQNLDLAKNIARMMSVTEGCTDNDLFLKAVTTMYNAEPSHTSAYFLYRLNSSKNNIEDAYKYLEEAIAAEDSDVVTDADYLYQLAAFSFKNGNNAKANEAALKAIATDDSVAGKSYMLIGTIWGSMVCPGNEIEKRAQYWVAVDYMRKAKNADPSLAEEADSHISQYSTYFPQTAEAFMYDITDGQSYTVSCGGLRATTTVKTQK